MDGHLSRAWSAVIYLRTASSRPEDQDAIQRQREGCERIAARYRLTLLREYVDVGRPARWERQIELQRLTHELSQRRDAAFVIVWNYACLAENLAQLDEVILRIRACGAEVATLTGMDAAARFTDHQDTNEREEEPS